MCQKYLASAYTERNFPVDHFKKSQDVTVLLFVNLFMISFIKKNNQGSNKKKVMCRECTIGYFSSVFSFTVKVNSRASRACRAEVENTFSLLSLNQSCSFNLCP